MNVPGISRIPLGRGTLSLVLAIAVALSVAAVARGVAFLMSPSETRRRRWKSVGTWWALFLLVAAALAAGRPGIVVLFAGASLLALREGVELAGRPELLLPAAAGTIGVYAWAWLDWRSLFLVVLPGLVVVLVIGEATWRLVLRPRFADARDLVVALWAAVVGPSFVVAAASLPVPRFLPETGLAEGGLGWLVLLLSLTWLNDIAQAWWGRLFGSRPLAETLSPRKTWAGFVGGAATTVGAALVLAPMVTSWGRSPAPSFVQAPPRLWAGLVGLLVATAGLGGDLLVSALKRRAGVKDSGRLLPGQGGVLDRVDSLSLAAPLYFALTWATWSGAS